MKDYKRLTDRTEENFCDAWYCSNEDCDKCDAKKNFDRLAELEDKIESGELCDREEVRKETAKEILQELYNRLELVSEDGLHTTMVCNTHLAELGEQDNPHSPCRFGQSNHR